MNTLSMAFSKLDETKLICAMSVAGEIGLLLLKTCDGVRFLKNSYIYLVIRAWTYVHAGGQN